MNIVELVEKAHANAIAKGWWKDERTYGELIALVHSEVSEALEDIRAGKKPDEIWYEHEMKDGSIKENSSFKQNWYVVKGMDYETIGKPCGVPSELADVCIRIFDIAGKYGWSGDLEECMLAFSKKLSSSFWMNSSVIEKLNMIHCELSMSWSYYVNDSESRAVWHLTQAVDSCRLIAEHQGIDLEKAIAEKMEYNATRPERHGGKVL